MWEPEFKTRRGRTFTILALTAEMLKSWASSDIGFDQTSSYKDWPVRVSGFGALGTCGGVELKTLQSDGDRVQVDGNRGHGRIINASFYDQ